MFEATFMRVALLASVAASIPLSVLGVYLIIRRVVFFGLVLANAATVGAAVAQAVGWSPEVTALAASVLAALGMGVLPTARLVSTESIIGWAYATAAGTTVLILAGTAGANTDTLHLLYGNVLAVSAGHATGLAILALAIGFVHLLFGSRFLLVTFDAETAQVAGVNTRFWSICLNLLIGAGAAAAVHEIGALLTFSLLTLAPMAALLVARRIRTAFLAAALIGMAAMCGGLVLAFRLDLPPGPVSVELLVLAVVAAGLVSRWRG